MPRHDGRMNDELRPLVLETGISRHAEGSCLIKAGNTHVMCTASLDSGVPPFLRGKGQGWVTAEYGMLPRSTDSRMPREAARGKQSGRTQEIQRLIGRSLRAITDFSKMGERQIIVDCDVIQADGGTRTASITGGYVALALCFQKMLTGGLLETLPLTGHVAAVSCGVLKGEAMLDLNYEEDAAAEVDSNFVFTGDGRIVEIQGTAEEEPFTEDQFNAMMVLARKGIAELVDAQKKVLA